MSAEVLTDEIVPGLVLTEYLPNLAGIPPAVPMTLAT
jgi:hypothetical protein